MSLINDALKKAARQRAEEEADLSPLMPGGSRSRASRERKPLSTQTMVLIGAAAVALIIVSAVITGVLVTNKPETKAPVAAAPTAAPEATQPAAVVSIQMPTISLPKPSAAMRVPTPAPLVEAKPAPTAVPTAAPIAAPTAPPLVVAASPAVNVRSQAPAAQPLVQTAAPADQTHADQVQAVIDGLHVSGARAAGSGSKALIDGHVYRINDLIDRASGLRLIAVDTDHLTLVDATGATYTKSF